MKPNVKLLRKVRDLIAEEPRRLRMGTWGQRWTKRDLKNWPTLPPCGTTGCLAGHIVMAHRGTLRGLFRMGVIRERLNGEHISRVAARLIGIPRESCPFNEIFWGKDEVLAWIDRQIDAATK